MQTIINPYSKSHTYCITLWIVHPDPCTFHLPAASLPAAQRQRAHGHAGHRHAQLLAAGAAPAEHKAVRGCASRLTHPPPLGLLGPLHGFLLLLAPEDVLLEDAADDDDARALDEHSEERAHERLGEAEQKRVLWSDRGEG